jgi:8-amino-7-oxononanoate synthase
MTTFDEILGRELEGVREAGLLRILRVAGGAPGPRVTINNRNLVNFSSNDYLGLARHPAVTEAAAHAAKDLGGGSAASRLLAGSLPLHHRLEESLAAWKGVEASVLFSSGYSAALGTVPALVGPTDYVVVDRFMHACCIDGARLSRATLRVFHHNDADHLDEVLGRIRASNSKARILVMTESVFSMDGDLAPLADIVEIKDRHGAWLMLDEAHATGMHGARRSGLAEAQGLTRRIEVHLGTLGKALGSSGGYIAGSATLGDWLVNRARSFIYSTAPAPAASAAALAALSLLQGVEGEARSQRVWENARKAHAILPNEGRHGDPVSAILPWVLGDEERAVDASAEMADNGIFAPAIRFPTVARGAARLRFAVSAAHDAADLYQLATAVAKFEKRTA